MTAPAAATDLTAPGALDAFRTRFEEAERQVAAFVDEAGRWERLAGEVAALGGAAERGPLHGVALGVKDVFHVDGLPTRAGSLLPPEVLAGTEASCVTRLRAAGAVVV
ncbi:MAG TPA: amidase family protein, partial [Thermoanaerobaculia bacterium]|nr:amidase family protein [Thermoanaerobaculia bacterium]